MAWFWQRKKEEKERREQALSSQTKKEQLGRVKKTSPSPVKVAETKLAKKSATKITGIADRVLLGPFVTEKAARLGEKGTYAFMVTPHATKLQIERAVRELYTVHPTKVTVLNSQRKPKMFAQRYGRRSAKRKAYVTLKKGETIDLFKS